MWTLFLQSFKMGGVIMISMLIVSIVVWTIGFGCLLNLFIITRARNSFFNLLQSGNESSFANANTGFDAYNNLLLKINDIKVGKISANYVLREFLLSVNIYLTNGYNSMKTWIYVAPLLGLLGTVLGMVKTFRIITEYGIDNPQLMADGISMALLTTQAGLVVAFPAMLFHNYLINKRNNLLLKIKNDNHEFINTYEHKN